MHLDQLGVIKMIEVMTLICPGIKDTNTGIIINMDYKVQIEISFMKHHKIEKNVAVGSPCSHGWNDSVLSEQ